VTLTEHDSDSQHTLDSEQNRKCHKASRVGIMLLRQQCLRLNAGTTSGDGAVLIVRIRLIFGISIWPNTNTLFSLLLGLNKIQIKYSVQPYC